MPSSPAPPTGVETRGPMWAPDTAMTTWVLRLSDRSWIHFYVWDDGRFLLDAGSLLRVRDTASLRLIAEACTAIADWSEGRKAEMPGQLSLLEAA